MATNTVPNPPYKAPMLDAGGFLTQVWSSFFQQLFIRIGNNAAPSNTDLTNQISILSREISALQANDLSQGPIL